MTINISPIRHYLTDLQTRICNGLTAIDGREFIMDEWSHSSGGGGCSRVLEQGQVIERGGVNFSHVFGAALPKSASDMRQDLAGHRFQALGVSLVIHPRNPYAPTSHMNVRFIATENDHGQTSWWFGGGFDLTPYYGFTEDCQYWHQMARDACHPFGAEVYPRYKKACDDYFYLKHRQEPRGIGGIFFDDLNEWGWQKCFAFMQSVGDHYLKAYLPILSRRKDMVYGERERDFQCYRRGRYVEFNLVYDRGTLFGLQSNGRTESILMSLPPVVYNRYRWQPQQGSIEDRFYRDFLVAREWI